MPLPLKHCGLIERHFQEGCDQGPRWLICPSLYRMQMLATRHAVVAGSCHYLRSILGPRLELARALNVPHEAGHSTSVGILWSQRSHFQTRQPFDDMPGWAILSAYLK